MALLNSISKKNWLILATSATVLIPLLVSMAAFCSNGAAIEDVQVPTVTPEMRSYSHIRYALYFIGVAYDIMVLLIAVKLSARMRNFAESRSKFAFVQFVVYYIQFFLLIWLANIPWKLGAGFWLEHYFHLSHQPFFSWCTDQVKSFGVGLIAGLPLAGLFFLVVRRFPKRWPYLLFVGGTFVAAFEIFISPIVLEPVFNKFSPLPPGKFHQEISALADAAGAPGAPIYVADKSKQTNKLNAYVSGFGPSMRIVIWDTTLNKLPEDQTLAIVGHELGHYFLKHIYWGFLIGVIVGLIQIPINLYLARPFVARLPKSWEIRGLEDFAILPVIGLIAVIGSFVSEPIVNLVSRYDEHQADAFSLSVTKNGPALARAFVALSTENLSEPDPPRFIKFWLFSHPTLKERIEFALGKSDQF